MLFCFGMMSANLDSVVPNLASISDSLDITATQSQLALSIFIAGAGFGQILFGPLADAYGRRPGLLLGIGTHFVGTLTCAASFNLESLLIGRLLQGIGTAAAVVNGRAILRDLYIDYKLAVMLSFSFMMITPIPMFSAVVGHYLQELFAWQAVFIGILLYNGIFAWLVIFKFKETIKLRNPTAIQLRFIFSGCKQVLVNSQSRYFIIVQLLFNSIMFGYIISSQRIFSEYFEITGVLFSILYGVIAAAVLPGQLLNQLLLRRTNTVTATVVALVLIAMSAVYGIVLYLLEALHYIFYCFNAFLIVSCVLVGVSNTVALIMNPHGQHAGMASSLLGFTGFLFGSLIGTAASFIYGANPLFMFCGIFVTSTLALLVTWYWKTYAEETYTEETQE